jgi:YD repeat-containing protein
MIRTVRSVGLLLLLLVFGVFTCGATIDRRAPLVLRKFQISIVDAASRTTSWNWPARSRLVRKTRRAWGVRRLSA